MKIKFIHYTDTNEYLTDKKFVPSFKIYKNYPKIHSTYGSRWIGDIGEYHIIVKKMTKKEITKEIKKEIKLIYKILDRIPYIKVNKVVRNKVLLCKFYGYELWRPIEKNHVKLWEKSLKE
ncbi:MAG: hypothetical protein ACTSVB_04060 [Candidatus Heimdallarchaeaceae archaeon]